jgi:hypothetical protein
LTLAGLRGDLNFYHIKRVLKTNELFWTFIRSKNHLNIHSLHRLIINSFTPDLNDWKILVLLSGIKNRPIRNKNCLWWPCLLMDRDEMSNIYRGPSIDASYQVSVHLVEGFQRRRLKCEKLTDDGRQVMTKVHIAFGKTS